MLSRVDKFEAQIKCPYCSSIIEVSGVAQHTLVMVSPEMIVPFKTTEKDFKQAVCRHLLGTESDNIVCDIFDKVEMDNVTAIYLPMYLFEGKYETEYKCTLVWSEKNADGEKYTCSKDESGNVKSNYSILCLAYDGLEITEELAEWTHCFPYDPAAVQTFKSEFVTGKGYQILPRNLDREATWNKWGADIIEDEAEQEAFKQLPEKTDRIIRDYRSMFDYHAKHEGHLILAPFWFVYYTYDYQKYFLMMDGLGKHTNGSKLPQDENIYEEVKKNKKLDTRAHLIAAPLAALILFFTPHFLDSWIMMQTIKIAIILISWGLIWRFLGGEDENNILKRAYKKRKTGYEQMLVTTSSNNSRE